MAFFNVFCQFDVVEKFSFFQFFLGLGFLLWGFRLSFGGFFGVFKGACFSALGFSFYFPFVLSVLIMTFFAILLFNVFSLFPFGFSSSSQLWFSIGFGVFLFFSLFFHFFSSGVISGFSRFVPGGVPLFFGFVLFWVEVFSFFFRLFTLILRLCANLMAGHVMISVVGGLISGFLVTGVAFWGFWGAFLGCGLWLFELMVAFVQSFVFVMLLYNYYLEANVG